MHATIQIKERWSDGGSKNLEQGFELEWRPSFFYLCRLQKMLVPVRVSVFSFLW
jgi:hypothetical protein